MTHTDLIARLRTPPFGTETSERNLMTAAADALTALEAENQCLRTENQRLREAPDPDNLAQIIRAVDGSNRLGAGALAEKISAALRSTEASHDD